MHWTSLNIFRSGKAGLKSHVLAKKMCDFIYAVFFHEVHKLILFLSTLRNNNVKIEQTVAILIIIIFHINVQKP